MECVFCRIISGAEPAAVVHHDDTCVAFMDVHPLTRGHVLLVPARHVEKLEGLADGERAHLYRVQDRLVAAQRRAGFGREGTQLICNDGAAANQHIPHAHLHLVPRRRGDTAGFALRLLLHATGLFGLRTGHARLEVDARAIAEEIRPDP